MYHQQQQQPQSQSQHLSSRSSLPPEKHFLLQGGGDSGLVLSTDAKPRLKWTNELHERFVEAVNQLGGPDKATPKTIMRLMGIPGSTLYHRKSHLQKYRLSKNLQAQANAVNAKNVLGCMTATDIPCEGNGSPAGHLNQETPTCKSMHISEALQMQIEVQRQLHEQLEVQRHLQLRMEAQGKYLQSVLEKAQEALERQNNVAGTVGLGATKTQLSELVSKASAKRLQNEYSSIYHQHLGDGSVDSCLTACEGSHRGDQQDILSIGLSASAQICTPFETARSGKVRGATSTSCEEYCLFLDKPSRRASSDELHEQRQVRKDDGFSNLTLRTTAKVDLNMNDANSMPRNREKIDLNGSGWN